MTPAQARRRAARRIRRRRRRILIRALLFLPALFCAAGLAADFIQVSKEPAALAPHQPPWVSHTGTRASQPRVPVPVFHPSILLEALELKIPEIDSLDLELRDPRVEEVLARRRIPPPEKPPEPTQEPVPEQVRAGLIQLSAVRPHLLEILSPRPHVDPSAGLREAFPLLEPRLPVGWPGIGWVDLPLNVGGGLRLVKPLPGAKKKKKEEDDEEPPPAVPEPDTAALLLLGLALLGIAGRRPTKNAGSTSPLRL